MLTSGCPSDFHHVQTTALHAHIQWSTACTHPVVHRMHTSSGPPDAAHPVVHRMRHIRWTTSGTFPDAWGCDIRWSTGGQLVDHRMWRSLVMTFDNDFCVWRWHYRERHSRVSVNAQTTRAMHPVFAHLSHRAMIVTSGLIQIRYRDEYRNDEKCCFLLVFVKKNTHKTHEIVKVAVINDNNNFAPSLFRSLCEFVGDCFGPRYFSSGAALPQKNTSVQNNHLRFHTMTSKKMVRSYYCLSIIIVCYLSFLINMHRLWLDQSHSDHTLLGTTICYGSVNVKTSSSWAKVDVIWTWSA